MESNNHDSYNELRAMVETWATLGEKAYPNLRELPEPVDLVDVFRESSHVAGIVEECIALKLPALWLQDGVVDEAAARRARDAGLTVIMDRCIYRDYARLM